MNKKSHLLTTELAKCDHGLSIFTALDSKNRLELLADNVELANFAEFSNQLIYEREVVAKNTAPR
jgi:hypothetical protein